MVKGGDRMHSHRFPESGMQTGTREWSLSLCKAPWPRGGVCDPVLSGPSFTLSPKAVVQGLPQHSWLEPAPHSEGSLVIPSSTLQATGGLRMAGGNTVAFLE